MALIDNTYTLEAGTVYEFSNVVGIQNQSFDPILYTMGTTFSSDKQGIILEKEDQFTATTIFVKSNRKCQIMIMREV